MKWCWHRWRWIGETFQRPIPHTGCEHVHPWTETVCRVHCINCHTEKVVKVRTPMEGACG